MAPKETKETTGGSQAGKSRGKTTPSSRQPAATASTSTGMAAVPTGKQLTVQPKQAGGRQAQNSRGRTTPSSGQPPTSASASASASMTTATISIVKQPTSQWKQDCLVLMTAFPCMGKSSLRRELVRLNEAAKIWPIYDLDSSEFWPGGGPAGLPYYLCKIMETAAIPGAIVLVSAHKLLRQVLLLLGMKYVSVCPPGNPGTQVCKEARRKYLEREETRHPEDKALYEAMKKYWDPWMENERKEKSLSRTVVLENNEFLSDLVNRELEGWEKDWKGGGTKRYCVQVGT